MRFLRTPIFSLLIALTFPAPCHAQMSVKELEQELKRVEKPETDEERQLFNVLDESLELAKKHQANLAAIKDFKARIKAAPDSLSKLRQNPPKPSFPLSPPENISRKELENTLNEIHAELETQRKNYEKLQNELSERDKSTTTVAQNLATRRNELNELDIPGALPSNASKVQLAELNQKKQRKQYLESEIEKLKAEQDCYIAEQDLLRVKSHILSNNIIKPLIDIQANWQKVLQQKTIAEAEAALKQARIREASLSNIPELAAIARSNAAMAELRSGADGLSSKIASAYNYRTKLEEQIARIKREEKYAKDRIELLENADLEIDSETGRLLRKQRSNIPDTDKLEGDLRRLLSESATAQLELIKFEHRSTRELTDIEAQIKDLYERHKDSGVKEETIRELLNQKRELLEDVTNDYRTYSNRLNLSIGTTKQAISTFSNYALFLDERLLWIPSAERLKTSDIPAEFDAIVRAFSPAVGGAWAASMFEDMKSRWFLWAPVLILFLLPYVRRQKIIANLASEGKRATKRNCSSFSPTLKALFNSLLLNSPVPLAAIFLAWRTENTSPFYPALLALAAFSFAVGFIRRLSRPSGILESHIHLGSERTEVIYKNLRWYLPVAMPLVFLSYLVLVGMDQFAATGRITFIILLLVTGVLLFNITKPSKQVLYTGHSPTRIAKVSFILAVLTPLALITAVALGYISSVLTVQQQLLASLIIILTTLLVVALLLRWGLVSRRRLAINQALKRREAALAERKKKEEDGESTESANDIPTLEEVKAKAVDVAEVEEKTTRLIKVGAFCALAFSLWTIWAASLPALSFLDNVELWDSNGKDKTEQTANSSSPAGMLKNIGSSGSDSSSSEDSSSSSESLPKIIAPDKSKVTLQDLLIFFIALFLTFTAARNIPSLLELTLLSKLNLKPGGSFAVTTAITYTIVVVGIIIAFARIGITWSKVQWIAAAVTLGIGFGLQEVFANFVAGLILLFERPIRLGDYITVGDVSGRVTQIRIRATTIQQLNNRELVVPNKEFITGQVVNWTLKDALLRAEVTVGIAYGSDTELARQELLKVADANPRVVKSQKPDVIFGDFADSTLNFTLRCHVNGIEDFIPVQSELRFAIDKAFREHNIEIAFPQRDIHIRSVTNLSEALKEQAKEITQQEGDKK